MKQIFIGSLVLGVGMMAAGCGGGVRVELKNIAAATTSLQSLGASDQTSSVTIDSLRIPISDISLGTGDNLFGTDQMATLYSCAGTSDDCRVELVGAALSNLLTGGSNGGNLVNERVYTSVMVGTCGSEITAVNGTTYTAKIKAKATLNGTTYYTKSGSTTLVTTEADYSEVDISFSSCRNYTVLSNSFTYTGQVPTLNLYIDLRNIAYVAMADAAVNSFGSHCTKSSPTGSEVVLCLNYPNVSGSINSTAPSLRRYKVTTTGETDKAKVLGLYIDADGNPAGGYAYSYIATATQNGFPTMPSGFKKASLSGTTMTVSDYSGGSTVTDQVSTNGTWNVTFPYDIAVNATDNTTATGYAVTRIE